MRFSLVVTCLFVCGCVSDGDCIVGSKEVYQPFGGGGVGGVVEVPVRGKCRTTSKQEKIEGEPSEGSEG